ncbi:hypothetical protein V8C86DRAFT_2565217 [Haematococcus lacustris]
MHQCLTLMQDSKPPRCKPHINLTIGEATGGFLPFARSPFQQIDAYPLPLGIHFPLCHLLLSSSTSSTCTLSRSSPATALATAVSRPSTTAHPGWQLSTWARPITAAHVRGCSAATAACRPSRRAGSTGWIKVEGGSRPLASSRVSACSPATTTAVTWSACPLARPWPDTVRGMRSHSMNARPRLACSTWGLAGTPSPPALPSAARPGPRAATCTVSHRLQTCCSCSSCQRGTLLLAATADFEAASPQPASEVGCPAP